MIIRLLYRLFVFVLACVLTAVICLVWDVHGPLAFALVGGFVGCALAVMEWSWGLDRWAGRR